MKKITLILLIIYFSANAQRKIYKGSYETDYNSFFYYWNKLINAEYEYYEDKNGNRVYDGYFKFNGKFYSYDKSLEDQITANGKYKNNLKDGKWTYSVYHIDDKWHITLEINYKNGIKNGKAKLTINKNIYEINFKDNHYIGSFNFKSENLNSFGEFDEYGFLKGILNYNYEFNSILFTRKFMFSDYGVLNYITNKNHSTGKIDTTYNNKLIKEFDKPKEYFDIYNAYFIDNNWYCINDALLKKDFFFPFINDDISYNENLYEIFRILESDIIDRHDFEPPNLFFTKECVECNSYVNELKQAIIYENNNDLINAFDYYFKSNKIRYNQKINQKLKSTIDKILAKIEFNQSKLQLNESSEYLNILNQNFLNSKISYYINPMYRNKTLYNLDTLFISETQLITLKNLTNKQVELYPKLIKLQELISNSELYFENNKYIEALNVLDSAYSINNSDDILNKINDIKVKVLISLSDEDFKNRNYTDALKKIENAISIEETEELIFKKNNIQKMINFLNERKIKFYRRNDYDKNNYKNVVDKIETNLIEFLLKNFDGDINAKIIISVDTNGINKFEIIDDFKSNLKHETFLQICNKFNFQTLYINEYSVNTKDTFFINMKTLNTEIKIERKFGSELEDNEKLVIKNLYNNKYLNMPYGLLKLNENKKNINLIENISYKPKSFKYYGTPSNAFLSLLVPGLGNSKVGLENGLDVGTFVYSTIALGFGAKYLSSYYAEKHANALSEEDRDYYYTLQNNSNYAFYGLVGLGLISWTVNIFEVASKGYENKRNANEFKKSINLTYSPINNSFKISGVF